MRTFLMTLIVAACGSDDGARTDTDASVTGTTATDGTSTNDIGECPSGQLACGGACIDPAFDLDHCGRCDNACGDDAICDTSVCVCKSGFDDCGEGDFVTCVDTSTSRDHCGRCDNACGLGYVCGGDDCVLDCDDGESACGAQCVDTSTSREHCGACDATCGSAGECIASQCYCAGTFTIDRMTPTPNATAAPTTTAIRVRMSCVFAEAGRPESPLVVHGSRSGKVIGTTTYEGVDIVFTPSAPLMPGERVMVTLPADAVSGPDDSKNAAWVGQFEVATTPGRGRFEVGLSYPAEATLGDEGLDLLDGNSLRWVSAADVDHDGDDDVWLRRGGDFGGVGFVLLSASNAGTPALTYHAPEIVFGRVDLPNGDYENNDPGDAVMMDADGDGHADDIVEGGGSVYFGDDALTFTRRLHGLGDADARPLVGDLDGDGDLDLITNGIWLGDGAGGYVKHDFALGGGLGQLGDVDGDGDLDYVGSGGGVWLNDGDAYFTHFNPNGVGGTSDLLLRDFNGDGILDDMRTGGLWLGLGDGTFQFTRETDTGNELWEEWAAFDVDGDGDLDVVRVQGQLLVNDGAGGFTLGQKLELDFNSTVEVGDFDGDGALDVVDLASQENVVLWMNRAPQ